MNRAQPGPSRSQVRDAAALELRAISPRSGPAGSAREHHVSTRGSGADLGWAPRDDGRVPARGRQFRREHLAHARGAPPPGQAGKRAGRAGRRQAVTAAVSKRSWTPRCRRATSVRRSLCNVAALPAARGVANVAVRASPSPGEWAGGPATSAATSAPDQPGSRSARTRPRRAPRRGPPGSGRRPRSPRRRGGRREVRPAHLDPGPPLPVAVVQVECRRSAGALPTGTLIRARARRRRTR